MEDFKLSKIVMVYVQSTLLTINITNSQEPTEVTLLSQNCEEYFLIRLNPQESECYPAVKNLFRQMPI